MSKNILVTGGCGFIASNFINIFHQKFPQHKIINLDKLDYCSNIKNVHGVLIDHFYRIINLSIYINLKITTTYLN